MAKIIIKLIINIHFSDTNLFQKFLPEAVSPISFNFIKVKGSLELFIIQTASLMNLHKTEKQVNGGKRVIAPLSEK
jgi:hypothetical protein